MMKTAEPIDRIPPEVAERLGYYVYLYVDPRDQQIFYVGKGNGSRVLAHLDEESESKKCARIAAIRHDGGEPQLEILSHGLRDEETAFRVEAAVIDVLRLGALTNQVRGWKSVQNGRMLLRQLIGYYAAPRVTVEVPALLIRVNRLYRHEMGQDELYEVTRGIWRLGERRNRATHAFAVFEGVVREVFEVESWHPSGTTPYRFRDASMFLGRGRWEFVGRVAAESIRSQYVDRSVAHHFAKGLQTPTVYVNC